MLVAGEHAPPPAAPAPHTNRPTRRRTSSKGRKAAIAVTAAAAAVGVGSAGHFVDQPSAVNATGVLDREPTLMMRRSGFHCGKERWDVKTLTDTKANQVDLTPRPATVVACPQQVQSRLR